MGRFQATLVSDRSTDGRARIDRHLPVKAMSSFKTFNFIKCFEIIAVFLIKLELHYQMFWNNCSVPD